MLLRRAVLVLIGSLIVPTLAFAGPIQFGYATTAALSPSSPHPSAVSLEFLAGGTPYFNEYGGSFTIGWVRLNTPHDSLRMASPSDLSEFSINVTIDDQDGHHGVLTLNGNDGEGDDDRLDFGEPGDETHFTTKQRLGGNLYSLTASLKEGGKVAEVLLGVQPDPITTPEPTTLALAAIALLPLGARSLRGRRIRAV